MIIGAWFVFQEITQSFECAGVGSAIGVGFLITQAWLVLEGIFKSSEFWGVGSVVVIGFGNPLLGCILKDF